MPKNIIISKLGGPEVLKYQDYDLPNNIKSNERRITLAFDVMPVD